MGDQRFIISSPVPNSNIISLYEGSGSGVVSLIIILQSLAHYANNKDNFIKLLHTTDTTKAFHQIRSVKKEALQVQSQIQTIHNTNEISSLI